MTNTSPATGLQLRSTVKKEGILELSLATVAIPEPKPEEVIVRIDASPINLSFARTSSACPTRSGASEIHGQDAEAGWR